MGDGVRRNDFRKSFSRPFLEPLELDGCPQGIKRIFRKTPEGWEE